MKIPSFKTKTESQASLQVLSVTNRINRKFRKGLQPITLSDNNCDKTLFLQNQKRLCIISCHSPYFIHLLLRLCFVLVTAIMRLSFLTNKHMYLYRMYWLLVITSYALCFFLTLSVDYIMVDNLTENLMLALLSLLTVGGHWLNVYVLCSHIYTAW